MKYLKVIDNNYTKKYLPILRIITFNSLIDIIHCDDYINGGCTFSSFRCDSHDVAQFIAEKIINSNQKIWTEDQIKEMITIGIK